MIKAFTILANWLEASKFFNTSLLNKNIYYILLHNNEAYKV